MQNLLDSENRISTLLTVFFTGITCYLFLNCFDRVSELELIIFASLLGFGIGTIVSLITLTIDSVISCGLFSILATWFWYGSYFAISIGGTIGSIVGAGCAIFIAVTRFG
jgi:hypothetical protein